jgi:hypothetical protein
VWQAFVKPLAVYAALWAAFHYWLDFTNLQSIVLGVLFGSCYFGFKELSKKTEKAEDFIPYRVSIRIHNPRDLLFKYKFLKTEEEWDQLGKTVKDTSVLNRGINFTVLSLSKEGLPHLIWWDDHKMFLAGLPSFEEILQGLEIPHEPPMTRSWSPSLYFGYRRGKGVGDTIALGVRKNWWDKNKTPEIANTETDEEYDTGSVYLVLGTLPYWELGVCYESRGRDRQTELTKLGWTIKDYHDPEFSSWSTIEVQNEYFSVSQRFCETD